MTDLIRLATDLGRLLAHLRSTDPVAAAALELVLQRLNDGLYDRQDVSIGEAVAEVAKRF